MIEALNHAETDFKLYKLNLKLEKANFLLSVDWKAINSEREEIGLPKISNEKQRSAYIDTKFSDKDLKLLEKELKYNQILREYNRGIYQDDGKKE